MHFCTIKERKLVCIPNVLRTNVMPFCSLAKVSTRQTFLLETILFQIKVTHNIEILRLLTN